MKSKLGCPKPAGSELRLEIIYQGRKEKKQTFINQKKRRGKRRGELCE